MYSTQNVRLYKTILYILFLTCICIPTGAQTKQYPISEVAKTELLIKSIETLNGAHFVRNGMTYDAKSAANHLRMKWSKAGSKIKTANDFIEKIATKSSVTGELYLIKMADGVTIETGKYLKNKLLEIENKK